MSFRSRNTEFQLTSELADGIATDAAGVKLTYTPPSGKRARLRAFHWFNNSGAPTVRLEIVRGGLVHVLQEWATSGSDSVAGIILEPGDSARFSVAVAALAGSTADAGLHIEEQP